jgi:hypothetical protein
MTDRRELILVRLLAIALTMPGINVAARNKLSPDDTDLPAIMVLEGDETAEETDPEARPANAPRQVTMIPEIVIALGDDPDAIGTSINAMRAALYKAIVNDTTLLGLVVNGRRIRYVGAGTELGYGRTMEGTMAMKFAFTYLLLPSEL